MKDQRARLKSLDNNKLIDVVKNYKQYGYDNSIRDAAIAILDTRGISVEALKLTGNFRNYEFDEAEKLYKAFLQKSKLAFVAYLSSLIFILILKSHSENNISFVLFIASIILYYILLLSALLNQYQLDKILRDNSASGSSFVIAFLSSPAYFILYFHLKNKYKEKMKMIK